MAATDGGAAEEAEVAAAGGEPTAVIELAWADLVARANGREGADGQPGADQRGRGDGPGGRRRPADVAMSRS